MRDFKNAKVILLRDLKNLSGGVAQSSGFPDELLCEIDVPLFSPIFLNF